MNPTTTNVTISVPRFTLAANERLFVEFRRNQTAGINSDTATQRQLTFEVNAGVNNQIAHPTADDVAPTNAMSITAATGAFYNAGTLYYKSDAAGSFSFSNALTDGGSGPYSTTFPAIGTTGWTHALETDSDGPALRLDGTTAGRRTRRTRPTRRSWARTPRCSRRTRSSRSSATRVSRQACPPRSRRATSLRSPSPSRSPTAATPAQASTPGPASSSATRRRSTTATEPVTPSRARGRRSPSRAATTPRSSAASATATATRSRTTSATRAPRRASATAKVDTSAPSDPTLSYGSFTNADLNGGVVYYRPGAASGQFQVTAAGSTDTESGLASYYVPGGRLRLEHLRRRRLAHVQPHRRADRSGRAEQRLRDERRRPQLRQRLVHGHARLHGPQRHGADGHRRLLHDDLGRASR